MSFFIVLFLGFAVVTISAVTKASQSFNMSEIKDTKTKKNQVQDNQKKPNKAILMVLLLKLSISNGPCDGAVK